MKRTIVITAKKQELLELFLATLKEVAKDHDIQVETYTKEQ